MIDGHTVLRCDGPIDVTIGGNTTRVERFDLVTADPSLSVEVGAHVTVRGALHTVLRCDGPIDVTIGGNTTRVERFDLVTADPSLSVEVGAHVTVRGALSGNAGFSNAPFKISVVSV